MLRHEGKPCPSIKRFLVTGCARSGTKYMSVVMRRVGLDVPHERMGRDGISSWMLTVDAPEVPVGDSRGGHTFQQTVHIVRNPMRVIESLSIISEPPWNFRGWDFICQHTSCSSRDPLLIRGAVYWLEWNEMAQRRAHVTCRIDDWPSLVRTLTDELQIPTVHNSANIPCDLNTRSFGRLYHRIEELLVQINLQHILNWAKPFFRIFAHAEPVSLNALYGQCPELAERVVAKAEEYGYSCKELREPFLRALPCQFY